jgi:hypothetical protein
MGSEAEMWLAVRRDHDGNMDVSAYLKANNIRA